MGEGLGCTPESGLALSRLLPQTAAHAKSGREKEIGYFFRRTIENSFFLPIKEGDNDLFRDASRVMAGGDMDIILGTTTAWTEDSLQAYQEKMKSSQTGALADSVSTSEQTGVESFKDTDTVEISEEARNKLQESSATASETALSTQSKSTEDGSGEESSTSIKEILLKQIREIEEQLNDAKERLAAATAKKKQNKDTDEGEATQEIPEQAEAADASQAENAESNDDPEVKTIMSEISQLTSTLVTLNDQLLEEEQKGAAAGTTGSAGLNEGSGLSGGLGERLPINA
jgi:hypothetical protein